MGDNGQGMYWQGLDKAHWLDKNPPDRGPRHMAPCQGGVPCPYCKEDIFTEIITRGQVNPAREQMSPPWWGSSTGLKGCRRQQFPAHKRRVWQESPLCGAHYLVKNQVAQARSPREVQGIRCSETLAPKERVIARLATCGRVTWGPMEK